MSGGSYNYLFCHVDGLDAQREDLEAMVERLAELDYAADATAATHHVLDLLDQAEAAAKRLADVWRAVEWWDSMDCGEDQVREAAEEFAASMAARGGPK